MMRTYTEVVFRLFCDLMKWGVCNCGFLGVGRLIDFSAPSTISFLTQRAVRRGGKGRF